MDERDLIHDWNQLEPTFYWSTARVELGDKTLRDGLQNPSVVDPSIEDKIRLLHMMDQLGLDTADIGLPGAGPRAVKAVTALEQEIVDSGLSIRPNAAARTVVADVRPIADISQRAGMPIEVCTFIGSSPIRQYAEDLDDLQDGRYLAGRRHLRGERGPAGYDGYWLREHGYDPDDEALCKRIFKAAKRTDHTLTEGEVRAICRAG